VHYISIYSQSKKNDQKTDYRINTVSDRFHPYERGLPLYRLLRKTECFTWTAEAEEALGNLKALLTNAPILVPPPLEKAY
jgi:hypothetical protein